MMRPEEDSVDPLYVCGDSHCLTSAWRVLSSRFFTPPKGRSLSLYLSFSRLEPVRACQVYIHPIVPVLNETRHIVKKYNAIYHQKVKRSAQLNLK